MPRTLQDATPRMPRTAQDATPLPGCHALDATPVAGCHAPQTPWLRWRTRPLLSSSHGAWEFHFQRFGMSAMNLRDSWQTVRGSQVSGVSPLRACMRVCACVYLFSSLTSRRPGPAACPRPRPRAACGPPQGLCMHACNVCMHVRMHSLFLPVGPACKQHRGRAASPLPPSFSRSWRRRADHPHFHVEKIRERARAAGG